MGKIAAASMFFALLLASCASQDKVDIINFDRSPLFGMVYDDDNQPCSGAKLTIDGQQGPVTDIRGRFILPDLSRGDHTLIVQKEGFEELSLKFQFLSKTDVLYVKTISFGQLLSKAERSLEERKWDNADEFLARAEKLNPADPVLLYLRAVEMYKTGKYDQAVQYLNTIIEKGVKDANVYLFLADIYEKNLNNPEKAIENLQIYLEKRTDPDVQKRLDNLKGKK
jgi:tetratricopeptide (TPR) repeat protein